MQRDAPIGEGFSQANAGPAAPDPEVALLPIYALDGVSPQFEDVDSVWIAPDATIIGDVRIGRDASIWYGAVVRGDNEPISIGARSNVQEHVVMHTDRHFPLVVGEDCTIGHRAILHSCHIGNGSLVGMGAIILNGARIGKNCLVGAGALVTEGKVFEDNSLILGAPARTVRTLDAKTVASMQESADHYVNRGAAYKTDLVEVSTAGSKATK